MSELDDIWNGKSVEANSAGLVIKALIKHGYIKDLRVYEHPDGWLNIQLDFKPFKEQL